MQNTTSPAIPALEAIHFDLLSYVSGGCGDGGGCRKHCCPQPAAAPVQQTQILQLPSAPAPLLRPSGDSVSTNVSINGQPQA